MKTITGIMLWLAVAMSASAGPGRITVTNEAGIVFRDVEVLSEGGGVVTVKTTNGVEFIKPGGLPPELRDKVSRQEQQRTNAAPLFTPIRKTTDEFTGAVSDSWLAQAHGPKWEVSLYISRVNHTNGAFSMLTFFLRTEGTFFVNDDGGVEVVADGKRQEMPAKYTKNDFKVDVVEDLFGYEWASYMIEDEVMDAIKNARSLKVRLNGRDEAIVIDLPKMAGRYKSKKLESVVQVSDCVARPTEQNSVWWRWSYQFRAVNNDDIPVVRTFHIRFLDAAGFVVDEKTEHWVGIKGRSSKIVKGYDLVNAKVSPNIRSVDVKVE